LDSRSEPLVLANLPQEDSWFSGFPNELYLANVIERFTENRIQILTVDNQRYVTRIHAETWQSMYREARNAMETWLSGAYTAPQVNAAIREFAATAGAPEMASVIDGKLNTRLHYSNRTNGDPVLVAVGRGMNPLVYTTLIDAGKPLHYSEVHALVEQRTGESQDLRRVHSSLQEMAKLFGRGIYGLMEHMPLSVDERNEVVRESEAIIREGHPGRQWHIAELFELLEERCPDVDSLTPYVIGIALETSENLVNLGRGVWVAQDSSGPIAERIDIEDAIVSLLSEAGTPLKTDMLFRQLSEKRGSSTYIQIQPSAKLIRVAPNTWGLRDRDSGLSEHEINTLLDQLAFVLNAKNHGLHLDELVDSLRPHSPIVFDPYILLYIAYLDPRFMAGRGSLIGLSWWMDVRRLNASAAIQRAIREMQKPFTVEEARVRASSLAGREISTQQVSAHLWQKATYDADTDRWTCDEIEEDSVERRKRSTEELENELAELI
jgi:hypothetical protein